MVKKTMPEQTVKSAVMKIAEMVSDGDSLGLAKTKVCRTLKIGVRDYGILEVTEEYQKIRESYIAKLNKLRRFDHAY